MLGNAIAAGPDRPERERAGERVAPTIVVWGELVWDLFVDARRLGGCAANVAYHAAQLGNRAVLVSRVGDDELGRRALFDLAMAGVDVSLVGVDRDAPTASVRVDVERSDPRYDLVTQAAWDRIELTAEIARAMSEAAVVCYGMLAQRTPIGGTALRAALAATPPGCVRLCDLNTRPPFATRELIGTTLASADAVKLNLAEAALLAQAFDVTDAARFLIEQEGVRQVAVTRGSAGSLLVTPTARVDHSGIAARAGGDPLGAGDAFTAVLAHHLARRTPPSRTAMAANTYASHVAGQRGGMPEIPKEIVTACR